MKTIKVNHADLEPVGDSAYRVYCPVCDVGILRMRRDFTSFVLLKWDVCDKCNTTIVFKDIADLRKREAVDKAGRILNETGNLGRNAGHAL